MKLRIRGPSGQSTITISDNSTVGDLTNEISKATSLPAFDLKSGFPLKPLDLTAFASSLPLKDTGLRLNGEQITVAARDIQEQLSHPLEKPSAEQLPAQRLPGSRTQQQPATPLSLTRDTRKSADEPPEIPIPSHESTVVLRVMPDDNSCMFRAVGSAVLGGDLDAMNELRSIVAQAIQDNPDLYSEAVLDQKPDDYCRWIQSEDSWGGGIELSILSQNFDIEIASIDVQSLRVDKFNEGRQRRIILVYSGIHYDTIALSSSEHPHNRANLPAEFDVKMFDSFDEEILEKARDLCRVLKDRKYYTDTNKFSIRCNKCGESGNGEKWAVAHATQSGHNDFGEGAEEMQTSR